MGKQQQAAEARYLNVSGMQDDGSVNLFGGRVFA